MNLENLYSLACRIFFGVAFLFLAVAILERVVREFGYTVLRGSVDPSRLLDFATVLLFFVVAILLRQIRDLTAKA